MRKRAAETRVAEQLEKILQGSLGLNIYPRLPRFARLTGRSPLSPRPFIAGLQMAILYSLGFAILPWLTFRLVQGDVPLSLCPLIVLQLYGALWSGWATASTRLANQSIMEVIDRELLPAMPMRALRSISAELDRRYDTRKLLLVSWALGAAAAAVAGILVYQDFRPGMLEILWWSVGWTLLYTTSAKVVIVGRFYGIFAAALGEDERGLFWLNPAASSVVASVALVAKRMLLFWLAIAISNALILPFGRYAVGLTGGGRLLGPGTALPASAVSLADLQGAWFVIAHLLGTAIFSIGVGSFVFLQCEARLRRVARRTTAAALGAIEEEVADLHGRKSLADRDLKRLADLGSLHAAVAGGASYRTFLLTALSLIIPFVPLLTLLLNYWRR